MCESCSNITISGNNFINFRRRRYPDPPSLPQPCRRQFCIGNGIRQRLQPSSGQARTASGGGLRIRVVLRDLDSAKVAARETFIDTLDPVSAPAELMQAPQSTRNGRRSRPSRSSSPSR